VTRDNGIIELLGAGQAVFGMFAPEQSDEGGRAAAANDQADFVFYSLEEGPWDIATMDSFISSMADASGAGPAHAVTLRIPPIRDDRGAARAHVAEGMASDVQGIVFPHVESGRDVEDAVSSMGDRLWPTNPSGDVLSVVQIEDKVGVARAREIVGAPGVGLVLPGQGDLRRAYEGDLEAVEAAVQTVLAACKELRVPCGVTAGVDDITERLEQGFKMIIVTQPEALGVGLAASGRGG